MGAARLVPCVLACIVGWASGGSSLVGPGAVGSYQGPSHGRRHGGFVHVNEPSVGLFVAGSSIPAMNGLYARVDPAAQDRLPRGRAHQLAYRHDYTGWFMVLASVPQGTETGQSTEWLFVDNDGADRFIGPGDTIIPPAGDHFRHAHRTASAKPDPAAGTAVAAAAVEDDPEELPWQIIGIGAATMMQQLRQYFNFYKNSVQQAIAGNDLPPKPPAGSAEEEETAPPETLEPPPLVQGSVAGELCEEEQRAEVKTALEQCVGTGNRWCQATIWLFVARCFRRQQKFPDAERTLLTSLEIRPRSREALLERGLLLLDSERYSEAVRAFEVLLRVDRELPGLLDRLVQAHAHVRRQEDAQRASASRPPRLEDHATEHCVAWRQTGGCDPSGPREPAHDRPCSAAVPPDASGFCECRGRAPDGSMATAMASGCGHGELWCELACRERWPQGAASATSTSSEQQERPPCESPEPPSWCSHNHYVALGVPCDLVAGEAGSESELLKRTYKRRSLQLHPDKNSGRTEAFQRVAEAHTVLADVASRRAYDDGEDLERGVERDGTQKPPHRQVIEKKYFPERFSFQPFGDPHADRNERREHQQRMLEQRRQRELELSSAKARIKGEEL